MKVCWVKIWNSHLPSRWYWLFCFIITYLFSAGKRISDSISRQTLPLHFQKGKGHQEVKDKHRQDTFLEETFCFPPWPLTRLYVWQWRHVHHSKVLRSFQTNMLLLICGMYLKGKKGNSKVLLVLSSYKREFYIVLRRLYFVNKVGATGLTFSNLLSHSKRFAS